MGDSIPTGTMTRRPKRRGQVSDIQRAPTGASTSFSGSNFGDNLSQPASTSKEQTSPTSNDSTQVLDNTGPKVDDFTKLLQCPICLQLMNEPYATVCSHTFCRRCLERSLQMKKRCPKCNFPLEKTEQIFPNETLCKLVQRCSDTQMEIKRMRMDSAAWGGESALNIIKSLNDPTLDLESISRLIEYLNQRKLQLEQDDKTLRNKLVKEFLDEMVSRRSDKIEKLNREVNTLEQDLKYMQSNVSNLEPVVPSPSQGTFQNYAIESTSRTGDVPSVSYSNISNIGMVSVPTAGEIATSLFQRRRRMRIHFDDLEQCYLSTRITQEITDSGNVVGQANSGEQLENFADCLTKLTQYNGFRQRATLNYTVDLHSGMNIVSSIEFDRDGEYFAIAGVTRKIKLYDYGTILRDAVDIHYPITEMQCSSKISCVSWNPYVKSVLASSDYEGIVQIWDVMTNRNTKKFKEHEKRCWSVCFNQVDTKMMASGSDDAKVKLWSLDTDHSIGTLEAKVNVCCVQFNPESRYHIAFGSADHCVHYYDLRNTKQAVVVCRGHKKAVSYVKFINRNEVISASTDSQLRLWAADTGQCVRVMKGHQNEKNFVGLATDGDYVACGSENNTLYVYYKELSKPVLTHSFSAEGVDGNDRDRTDVENGGDFVSAVCWKKNSNVILAANSQGIIKVLELV